MIKNNIILVAALTIFTAITGCKKDNYIVGGSVQDVNKYKNTTTYDYLKTNPLDQEFIDNFAQKTAIEHSFATELINHINYLSSVTEVSNSDLIKLNQLIEQFYKESR